MYLAGIDEAGRGPVLGPMVMAILAVEPEKEENLKRLGVKDSKLLSVEEREKLFISLRDNFEHEIIMLEPEEIDQAVLGASDNLNKLEARTTALLIKRLADKIPLTKVIVDSPAKDGEKYSRVIRAELDRIDEGNLGKIDLQCEIKADLNHPVVGAASILAKVTRDEAVKALETIHGPVGSGYPADPITKEFLLKNWKEGHDFFRKSWESYKRLADCANQAALSDFGKEAPHHKELIEAFEALKEHGFEFAEPTNQYEVLRMKKDKTTIIKYTTGKLVVQGPEKGDVEELLRELRL